MKVLITFRFFDEWVKKIVESGIEVIRWKEEKAPPKKWILDNVINVDGILCTLNTKIDKEVISAAKNLKVISTYSVGFDHIDVKEAKSRGIRVGYTPEVLTETTADLIFGLILAVARRIVEGDKLIREGKWMIPWQSDFLLGYDVYGKTLGIIGMGRIGKAVYRRAKGFNMRVVYTSRTKKDDIDAEFVSFEELLKQSDFVVITVDLNESTYHMINESTLRLMKKTAFLINASRGKVVDEKALVKALEEKWIAGAALDVFEEEPINKDHPLLRFSNVVLTPHIGSATFETRHKMAEIAVENLLRGLREEKLVYEL
ncbi:2-hydroxyacid dehydrogenase [Stygiolobus azoricus]|uniref:D-glycerate dehydrogenase n=1 Tax=Stygiolobus azoricus TaxID=41675 RepID=A0A650CRM0_9CREN|nr:D-glycerate dehydrogenase [Stygiolobus azoricus]QGR20127.1 D-glycerate dehydrogenase [Stygiolobus azoricus]